MLFIRCCIFLLILNYVSCNRRNLLNSELDMARRRKDIQNQQLVITTSSVQPDKPTMRTFPHEGGREIIPEQKSTTLKPPQNNQNVSIVKENDSVNVKYDKVNNTQLTPKGSLTVIENPANGVKNLTKLDDNEKKLTPDVLLRGLSVFSVFLFIAVAYFLIYRKRIKSNDSANMHSINDTNQFRYGVLQSDDRRNNMELSHVPLTMETDDEEDEDLEIFDLGQKKRTLSYVNLQQNDEEIVFNRSGGDNEDKDNLLLDIEEGPSDTLINWTNNSGNSNNRPML